MSGRRAVHRGHILHIAGRATHETAAESLVSIADGALVVNDAGTIAWVGPHRELPAQYAEWPVTGDASAFLLPGFVDAHVHFPQTFSTDGFGGGQLLEWLDRTVFPAEARLADPEFADMIARAFTRRRVRAGTTAAMVFGSAFPAAQDALFEHTREAGLRIVSGRGIQTVGPASATPLLTSEEEALALVADEIGRWHAADTGDAATALLQVAIVPRFSLSVTPSTLGALGELYDGVRGSGVYVHSHLNENDRPGDGEIAAVLGSYGTRSYLDTYDGLFLPGSARGGSSLLGPRTVLAHAVHCQDDELRRMAETGTSIAHCPTSQQFLGSGTMPWRRTLAAGVTVALGTDVGAGDEWLLPRVANDAFKVHLSEPGDASVALHPAELLFTATLAGARALDMEARFGNFDLGKDADLVRIEPSRWEPLAEVLEHGIRADDDAEATAQLLFALLMTLREPAIAAVHVQGRAVAAPE
ncbi:MULTISPECIES: amidohydrolase family protein [unclassified Rathayibacter]|uniref:amidohydrolase family protein n=1 Tax=unclassified Rathayibacter TaxID=2609250 RepID=UPI00188C32FC|nr:MULTISPECIES: amidohydrolase family protein [unclassified Rathayibacter]MBF4462133.1 amidohydrolase family protein [Rathayibacter sp. VKM Ac-2879]MBF4503824.1 amidohydrolase family protein [Rathayibacter sp. VKM Ac-2878]